MTPNLTTSPGKMMEDGSFHPLRPQEHELLDSIAKMERYLLAFLNRRKEESPLIEEGNEIMMDLCLTLQKLHIISDENLSHFLNKENKGQFILSYAINRLPHPLLQSV
jgi:hypothetical protein